jgi:hypothetical protein
MKQWITSIKVGLVAVALMLGSSCGNQGDGLPQIEGVKGPMLGVLDGQVLLTIKFLNVNLDAGLKVPIPKTRNSAMELAPNFIDGGMILQLYIDVEDLRNIDIGIGDGNTLPDGRAVPGIPGGRLENSLRIDTPWKGISFYYHKQLFGLWMPFGFETAGISGYFNWNRNGKRIGFLGLVGNDEVRGYKAGGILLLNLNNLKDKDFNRLIELSKRNPYKLY